MLATADAALLIGDPALTAELSGLHVLDLAEGWQPPHLASPSSRRSGPSGRDVPPEPFLWSRDYARHRIGEIIDASVARTGLERKVLLAEYFEMNLHYDLDASSTRRASPSSTGGPPPTGSSPRPTSPRSRGCCLSRGPSPDVLPPPRPFSSPILPSPGRGGSLRDGGDPRPRRLRGPESRPPRRSSSSRRLRSSSSGRRRRRSRRRIHPGDRATYQVDRNINYTNVCVYRCTFCAFYRKGRATRTPTSCRSRRSARRSRRRSLLGGTGRPPAGRRPRRAALPVLRGAPLLPPRPLPGASTATPGGLPRSSSSPRRRKLPWSPRSSRASATRGSMSVPGGGAEVLEDVRQEA